MPAENAVTSRVMCPLCGDADGVTSAERKRRLQLQLRSLETNTTRVKDLSSEISRMCGTCQLLMIGINSDDDRLELYERIQKELEPVLGVTHHTAVPGEAGSGAKPDSEHLGNRRDPEERPAAKGDETREKMLDKTLADSFPTSDPPSSIPDPGEDDSLAA